MSSATTALLSDRGVVTVNGGDAGTLLQGLVTNDIEQLSENGNAIHAGLLSPQGKILFDFFVVRHNGGYLIDVRRIEAPGLVKRLTMYRLRAAVTITDVSEMYRVLGFWGGEISAERAATYAFADPRSVAMGGRILAEAASVSDLNAIKWGKSASQADYRAHRIAIGAPEGGIDYDFGDAVPHEANFDLFNGVSFKKGCYVGQEVVARMQNKSVVRKRVVRIAGDALLVTGAGIMSGDVQIGRVGSTAGNSALAMLRLDRALEANENSVVLTAGGVRITTDQTDLDRYRASAAARPAAGALLK